MDVTIKDSDMGSIVDVDAELYKEIPNEIYVSADWFEWQINFPFKAL